MVRYERVEEILQLVLELQASSVGLCLDEISTRFRVSRRTAERMLAGARRLFPEIDGRTLDDGRKHWRLDSPRARGFARLDAAELAALETAIELVERHGRPDQVQALRALAPKVRLLLESSRRPGIETDAEALLEGEGLAMRPGPRPRIKPDIVEALREGILSCRRVQIEYRSRIRARESTRTVHPYGFLLGGRHYLIAHDEESDELRVFSLADVVSAELGDGYFDRPQDFDLQRWAARSFGVFQEEPRDVVWRFAPEVARDAREYRFHPTQRIEEQDDGSLIVRFRAGGLWEMAWHLFEWRDDVEVLEPQELRQTLVEMLEAALGAHRPR
jgi:predicted DNA-binding transcriptional regulator YafY